MKLVILIWSSEYFNYYKIDVKVRVICEYNIWRLYIILYLVSNNLMFTYPFGEHLTFAYPFSEYLTLTYTFSEQF